MGTHTFHVVFPTQGPELESNPTFNVAPIYFELNIVVPASIYLLGYSECSASPVRVWGDIINLLGMATVITDPHMRQVYSASAVIRGYNVTTCIGRSALPPEPL